MIATRKPKRGRGRPPDPEARARRRTQLLEAAASVFAREGYADADMQDIADAAGVGKGTLYRYFPSKKDLFQEAVDHRVEGLGDHVDEEAAKVDTPVDKMRAATAAYLRWTDAHPEAVDLILQELAVFRDERKPRWFVFRDRRVIPWQKMFGDRIRRGELRRMPPARITDLVSDALYGRMFANRFARRESAPEEQADALLDIVFHGILEEKKAPAARRRTRRTK